MKEEFHQFLIRYTPSAHQERRVAIELITHALSNILALIHTLTHTHSWWVVKELWAFKVASFDNSRMYSKNVIFCHLFALWLPIPSHANTHGMKCPIETNMKHWSSQSSHWHKSSAQEKRIIRVERVENGFSPCHSRSPLCVVYGLEWQHERAQTKTWSERKNPNELRE